MEKKKTIIFILLFLTNVVSAYNASRMDSIDRIDPNEVDDYLMDMTFFGLNDGVSLMRNDIVKIALICGLITLILYLVYKVKTVIF